MRTVADAGGQSVGACVKPSTQEPDWRGRLMYQ